MTQLNPPVKREIVLCERCDGRGYVVKTWMTNYHRGEYDSEKVKCPACQGSGRLEQRTTVEHTPYKQPDSVLDGPSRPLDRYDNS